MTSLSYCPFAISTVSSMKGTFLSCLKSPSLRSRRVTHGKSKIGESPRQRSLATWNSLLSQARKGEARISSDIVDRTHGMILSGCVQERAFNTENPARGLLQPRTSWHCLPKVWTWDPVLPAGALLLWTESLSRILGKTGE